MQSGLLLRKTLFPQILLLTICITGTTGAETRQQRQPAHPTPEAGTELSKEFQRAAVSALGEMRQWTGAVGEFISTGVPVVGQWPQQYRNRVDQELRQAAVAASTNGDRQALQLVQRLYDHLGKWSDTSVADRNALRGARSRDPNTLQNDPTLAKITRCEQFLGSMIVDGAFVDDGSCH